MSKKTFRCKACGNKTKHRYKPNKCGECRRSGNMVEYEEKKTKQEGLDGF